MFSFLFQSKEDLKKQFLHWWKIGHFPEAAKYGEKLVKKDPGDYQTLHDLGVVYLHGENPGKALDCFVRANAIHETAIHWNNVGRAHQALGSYAEALAAYDRARGMDPDDPQPWYNTSVCQRESGDMEASYQTLMDFIDTFPRHAASRNDLALHLEMRDRKNEAITHLEAALDADPGYDPARQNVVRMLADRDDLEQAMKFLSYWKQKGWSVEVETGKGGIRIKVKGFVMYERAR